MFTNLAEMAVERRQLISFKCLLKLSPKNKTKKSFAKFHKIHRKKHFCCTLFLIKKRFELSYSCELSYTILYIS